MAPETAAPGRVRLVDEITDYLRELIVTGQLPAGTQLTQAELADRMGISRTPLREAFRVLENDGLIRPSNGNGTAEVVTIDANQLREMYELREVIDGLAARSAARAGFTKAAEKEARQLLRRMRSSIQPFDPSARIEAHAAFHSLIAEASGSRWVQEFIPLIRLSSAALYLPFIENPSVVSQVREGRRVSVREVMLNAQVGHEAIVAAIVDGDPRKAEAAARRHVAGTLQHVDKLDLWRTLIAEARAPRPFRRSPLPGQLAPRGA
ncbi:MAG: GntR family transcriptional regulator [Acidimicrobiales bacterium]|nr:GntR family transcriptional regulator [Acidimicrobiales bacterium]